jgi:threonine dehydrogenase-like Zn-dependent dehydrogenase
MKAVTWKGTHEVEVDTVEDPKIEEPGDVVLRVTSTAICGSDLHLYDGYIPTMKKGDVLGHEFMGEVLEVGPGVTRLKRGDRILVPFNIACGSCWFCQQDLFSLCDNSNRNADKAETIYGHSPSGLFGYSHLFGGYAGGQAEYVRVPYADVGALKIPEELPDEKVLFLTDIFPTGYQAAENCNIHPGDVVAVWGCGPVGQFSIRSAFMLGAERVLAIDRQPERLEMARQAGAETFNFKEEDVFEELIDTTNGRGPDSCIDAVGLEAHGTSLDALYDRAKVAMYLATDRIHVLRQAAHACRKGGTLSIPGVYAGFADKFPIGQIFSKALTIRCGQTHTHRYLQPLLERVQKGDIDPTFVITHRFSLDQAAEAYNLFSKKEDNCIKCVLTP